MIWARKFVLVLGLALGMAQPQALAQINPTLSEAERGIKRDGSDDAARHLRIEHMHVTAHVVGRTADIALELVIASDNDDPYSATLSMAMPPDAVVTGYALNVGAALIPGQLLEQPKAREIFEDEVREDIDPGLAEVDATNRFTTRIYPIDRKNPRRIRMQFTAPFDPERGIILPLSRDAPVGVLSISVTIDGYDIAPIVRFAGKPTKLDRTGASWHGTARFEQAVIRDGLTIAEGTLAGPLTLARHSGGETFFTIADHSGQATTRPKPGRLRVYWDRSLSHGRGAPKLEAEVLARLADATTPTAIDLVTFASDRPEITTVENIAQLRAALTAVTYRGATSLAGLDGVSLPPASHCVLVFDGHVTIDHSAPFIPDCSLSVLSAATDADGPRLGRIAQASGGRFIRAVEGRAAEAAATLADRAVTPIAVRDSAGRRIAFRALPARPGSWLLVGRLPSSGELRVDLSDGSQRHYGQPAGKTVSADAPAALWAAQEVQLLGDDPGRHQAKVDLARRYQVAGPAMAFLVLESPDQYLRADIAPPAGFSPEWFERYLKEKREDAVQKADARKERFAFVIKAWQERKSWWSQQSFARRPKARPAPEILSAPPAPPPPPPPPASVSSPIVMEDSAGEVIVTGMRKEEPPRTESGRPAAGKAIKLDLDDMIAKRPYIVALNAAAAPVRLKVLAEQERAYGSVPSFYLDTAEWFRLKGDAGAAEQLLLSALELPLSDDETRQIVAFRLERDGRYDRAVELAERLAAANAEFRPQPIRDLALALAARGRANGTSGRADLERALQLLTDAALNPASSDFDGFEVIALMEANALIADINAAGGRWALDDRLVALLDTDVRIVISWTADDADIDLWVDEPGGERVYYGDTLSSAGGLISNDMTDGYGPEEYAIRRAPRGAYRVRVNGYDADRLNPNGPGHVLVRLIRNFARPGQTETLVDVDLSFQQGRDRDREEETKPIATLTVGR